VTPWGGLFVGLIRRRLALERTHLTLQDGQPGLCEDKAERGDPDFPKEDAMIRKLKTGEFRIYSRHPDPRTGKRKNLGTFTTREKAEEHERAIQYFKRH
jgi:hypothetical protein